MHKVRRWRLILQLKERPFAEGKRDYSCARAFCFVKQSYVKYNFERGVCFCQWILIDDSLFFHVKHIWRANPIEKWVCSSSTLFTQSMFWLISQEQSVRRLIVIVVIYLLWTSMFLFSFVYTSYVLEPVCLLFLLY